MRAIKLLSIILAALVLLSVCSFAAPGDTTAPETAAATTGEAATDAQAEPTKQTTASAEKEPTTQADNAVILGKELKEFAAKNNIDAENLTFAYCDFNRELRYVYNGDRLFASNDALKFPLAYLYFKDLVSGKHHLNEDVGQDNLRTVFLRSLTKDYGHDENATAMLIEKYGGMEAVKRALYEITYTKVDDDFYTSDALSSEYALDFLTKYYNEALYCSTDFKHMLIDPIKQFSMDRYSETYIYDYKITHRYGIDKASGTCMDMGIVNSSNPFAFVIAVEGSSNPEEDIALLAEFAKDFNEEYGSLLLSQMTTLPDVAEEDKKGYDSTKVTAVPLMVIVITATVVVAAAITIAYIVRENKKKNQDRLD